MMGVSPIHAFDIFYPGFFCCLSNFVNSVSIKKVNNEYSETSEGDSDPLTRKVIECAIEVHRHLGPGLLEST
jgi:hypothetical protein